MGTSSGRFAATFPLRGEGFAAPRGRSPRDVLIQREDSCLVMASRQRRIPAAPGWFCRSSGRSNLLPPRGKWPKADRGNNHGTEDESIALHPPRCDAEQCSALRGTFSSRRRLLGAGRDPSLVSPPQDDTPSGIGLRAARYHLPQRGRQGGGRLSAAPLCSYSMKMLSSFSTQSETGMVRYSVGLWRITTRSMPALMICRLHMEQLMASLKSSPVLASRPTR